MKIIVQILLLPVFVVLVTPLALLLGLLGIDLLELHFSKGRATYLRDIAGQDHSRILAAQQKPLQSAQ